MSLGCEAVQRHEVGIHRVPHHVVILASAGPAPVELALDHVCFDAPQFIITAHARRRAVPCPLCGRVATRVRSRYYRTMADLPWQGLRVRLIVGARRFFCDAADCARRVFTERFPATVAPYG